MRGSRTRPAWLGLLAAAVLLVAGILLWRRGSAPATGAAAGSPGAPAALPASAAPGPRPAVSSPLVLAGPSPLGTLRLVGQVVNASGGPVAGATVTLSTQPARTASTDASGTFELAGVPGGRYLAVARFRRTAAGPVPVQVTDPPSSVTLRLRSATELRVTVTSPEGVPIGGAEVELRGVTSERGTTAADGKASLWAEGTGALTLVGAAPGWGRAQRRLAIPAGLDSLAVDLVLSPGAPVAGRVFAEGGQAVAAARVWYERAAEPAWASGDPRSDGVDTDGTGTFRFPAVPLGSYRFLAQHPAFAPGASGIVMVDGRRSRSDVTVVLAAGGTVCGRAEEVGGAAAAWARVRIASARPGGAADPVWQATSGLDGAFCVEGLPRKELVLVASTSGASSPRLPVDLGARARIDGLVVRLSQELRISGLVKGLDGEPVPDVTVTALPRPSDADLEELRVRDAASDITGLDGRFTVRGLAAGVYALRASRRGAPRPADFYGAPSALAEAGRGDVVIVLPGEGGIRGKVAFADGRVPPIYSVGLGPESSLPFSATDGTFALAGLEAGRFALAVSGPTFESRIVPGVQVEADRTADLGTIVVEEGRSAMGRVVTSDGTAVPDATVFSGKMLVGTGESLTTTNWGAPGSPGAPRSTTTDPEGNYRLDGVGYQEFALVADHPTLGRSAVVKAPAGEGEVHADIVLAPAGAIEGHVTRGGGPVEGATVNVSPATINSNSHFLVTTGPDGRFRFDRLSAARYFVTAMTGRSPLTGVARLGRTVEVASGKTANLEIALPEATVTLTVSLLTPNRAPVEMGELHVVSGRLRATVAREVREYVSNMESGFSSFNVVLGGRPARVAGVPAAASFTACAIAYPAEVAKLDTPEIMKFVAKEGNRLPAVCLPIEVTTESEQRFAVEAPIPPLKG